MPVVTAALGAYNIISGAAKESKAKGVAAELERNKPKYQIAQGIIDNEKLAESELQQGMSAKAEQAYNYANDKAVSSAINANLKGGGSLNNIGDIYGSSNEGRMRLAQMQDSLRLAQIQSVVNARKDKAQEQQTQWQVNEYAPYKDKLQATGQARQAAANQTAQGVNTLASGVMQGIQNYQEKDAYDKYFKGGNTPTMSLTDRTPYNPSSISSNQYLTPSQSQIRPISTSLPSSPMFSTDYLSPVEDQYSPSYLGG